MTTFRLKFETDKLTLKHNMLHPVFRRVELHSDTDSVYIPTGGRLKMRVLCLVLRIFEYFFKDAYFVRNYSDLIYLYS